MSVLKCNTKGLSSVCIATVFVPKVESGERSDVPKVELGKQRVQDNRTINHDYLKDIHVVL